MISCHFFPPTQDVEPLEGECFSVVYTGHDRVWVSRALSSGGQLSVYDARKCHRVAAWCSKEIVTKLLYSSAEDIVVAITVKEVHIFSSSSNKTDELQPVLSQPIIESFPEVVLAGAIGKDCYEIDLWYSVDTRLKALKLSPSGITSETFRQDATSVVERIAPLGEAKGGRLKDVVLSHHGYIEKWDVDKMERSDVCNCYDFCSHLCKGNCKQVYDMLFGNDISVSY